MASDNPWKRLQEEATCSVCWNYYVDPCILDCGHSFCETCVSQCWKEFPENAVCPQCRAAVERKNCLPNTLLAKVVEIAKQLSSLAKGEGEGELVCEKHSEPFGTVFCVRDQIFFCRTCEVSERHSDHEVASVEETALLYQSWYSNYIRALKEERSEMVQRKFRLTQWDEQLQKNSIVECQTIAAGFKQLHDLLKSQEDCLLLYVQSVPRETAQKINNHDLANLYLDTFTLENNIRQLEEKASQPMSEFLQDAMVVFNRCQRRARLPALEDALRDSKWGFWEMREMSAMVRGVASYFKETLQSAFSVMRARVTLDADSSHPQLRVAPDGTGVKWKHRLDHSLPNSRKRFEKLCCVVGCQEFTIGRHFWEVIVDGDGEWIVGVAKRSVKRKGFFNLGPREGIFALGKLKQHYRIIDVPGSPILPLDGEPRWIRVSLNCSAGQVNFYDVPRAERIYGFSGIGRFRETYLPFFWLSGDIRIAVSNQ